MKPLISQLVIKGYGLKLKQRGIIATFYLYAAAILAVTMALGALYWRVDSNGYNRGKAETEAKQLAANQRAEAAEKERRIAREKEAADASKRLQSAENKARSAETRWRASVAEGKVLATAVCPNTASSSASIVGNSANPGGGADIRINADGVRIIDGSWSNKIGEPVFGNLAGLTDEAIGTYSIAEAIRIGGENAILCSADRRRYNALIDLLTTLRQ